MSTHTITEELMKLDIENVFIYVADAVRWDALPDNIANSGLCARGIASSIHTPTSFSTIVTGQPLRQHGVSDFGHSVPSSLPNLLRHPSIEAGFSNTINSSRFNNDPHNDPDGEGLISSVLSTNASPPDRLESIEPPFLFMERGPGGHAPYGDFDGNAWDYFESRGDTSIDRYVEEYRESVRKDVNWFWSQLSVLEERGLLNDTLVVYTSDHGELLGEAGLLGHNGPIHKKLVYVPVVLLHDCIENTLVRDAVVRHVDYAPTIASLLKGNEEEYDGGPGVDLSSSPPSDTGVCSYSVSRALPFGVGQLNFKYHSVWDSHGGYVFPESSRTTRMAAHLNQSLRGPSRRYLRNNLLSNISKYMQGPHIQGTPQFPREEAEDTLAEYDSWLTTVNSDAPKQVDEEHLRNLGYLE
jgi:hypothetical protein